MISAVAGVITAKGRLPRPTTADHGRHVAALAAQLLLVVGRPLPGNRNDCPAWAESAAKQVVGNNTLNADGGYLGTGLIMPHHRRKGEELPDWKQAHNKATRGFAPPWNTPSPV